MNEDKKLTVLAAKAIGMEHPGGDHSIHDDGRLWDCQRLCWWNPLRDDGDALRLAVNLQLGISIPPVVDGRIEVVTFYGSIISIVEYPQNNDRNAATRRAIVRAAAEIGKQMP